MINTPLSNTALDFASCNQEKIQFIAAVQNHGVFAAFTYPDTKIKFISENFHQLVGGNTENSIALIGKRLVEVLSEDLAIEIQNKIKGGILQSSNRHSFEWRGGHHYDVFLFKIDQKLFGIEIELIREDEVHRDSHAKSHEEQLRNFVESVKTANSVETLGTFACKTVRELTGLDRVVLYRFAEPSWHGEVVAEDRAIQTHSFLHHKFPASDIPQPARDLYLKNQVRLIYDSSDEASPIFPRINAYAPGSVDLSNSRLRAVSKIHLEYLKNMKVVTSFSVAITVNQKLWGLIACHGSKRTYIPHSVRTICSALADVVAMASPMLEREAKQKERVAFDRLFQDLFNRMKNEPKPLSYLFREMDTVNEIFQSNGFALIGKDKIEVAGITPGINDLKKLHQLLKIQRETDNKNIGSINSLTDIHPDWKDMSQVASGVLYVYLNDHEENFFVAFRPELLLNIQWGGDPRKSVSSRNYTGQINPRSSFESWSEEVRNTSAEWKDSDLKGMEMFKDFIFEGLIHKQRLITELTSR